MRFRNTRLILGIFLFLTIGFSLSGYISYTVTKEYILSSSSNQTLPLISDNIYSAIKEDLIDPIIISSLMSNDAFLIEWVQSGEKELDAIKEYLKLIKKKYGYTSVFLSLI